MQTRPYSDRDSVKIWLNQDEQQRLLENTDDRDGRPRPRRRVALALGLHGLRTDELVPSDNSPGVVEEGVRQIQGGGYWLEVEGGKTETSIREVPLAPDIARDIFSLKRGARVRKDDPLIDVSKRTVRQWVYDARETLDEPAASELGMHDLRRTWATQMFYALAFSGNPIARELVMSWGGWSHTATGEETFKSAYLGPVPEWLVSETIEDLPLSG